MAEANRTNNPGGAQVHEYKQCPWGDLICGTKEQLQNIGIGPAMAFPGETNGPKRVLRVTDPRGFIARVMASHSNLFSVSIDFHGRERPQWHISDFAQGVRKEEIVWGDIYTGTAESLIAAGLVRRDQLPGQPGMRKTIVTILPDGSLPKGAPTANCREAREPGAKIIKKKSKTAYEVFVIVPEQEQGRRHDKYLQAEREWKARMMSLPRPAPLCDLGPQREKQLARDTQELAAFTLNMLDGYMDRHNREPFTQESEAKIWNLISELKTAFAEAKYVEIPRYKVEGNIIRLGR